MLGLYGDNGKEKGNHYNGLYRVLEQTRGCMGAGASDVSPLSKKMSETGPGGGRRGGGMAAQSCSGTPGSLLWAGKGFPDLGLPTLSAWAAQTCGR